jgi:glycosyltransferase involved in cell wall biosynthesis
MVNKKILITIAIPFYNGLEQINSILDELYSENDTNYEILIIDDNSNIAETNGLNDLIKLYYNNGNLRYLYNNKNLGMDLNFEKCIKESLGLYTWFFGQDDYVSKDNLNYCISQIDIYKPDIIFANYSINRTWNYKTNYVFNDNLDNYCSIGAKDFLNINNGKVPSFLPSLIIRKGNWPDLNIVKSFYGTHFIQLAVFIYNIGINKKWLYIGKPLAIGVIPSTGWQNSLTNRIKYYKGFIECLDILQKFNFNGINEIVKQQKNNSFLQHIMLSIESKLENKKRFLIILSTDVIFLTEHKFFTKIIFLSPKFLFFPIKLIRNIYFHLKQS